MPLETRWPWAVRSPELQPSAAHCHGQAGYCGSAASGYHCRSSTQAGKMRVPTSNEGLYCHLAKWARSDLEDPSTASKGNCLKATVFFGMVSAKLWSWVAPDATSTTLCPVLYLSSAATTKSCLWSSSQHCHRGVLWLVGFVFCFFFKGQKKLKTAKMNLHQNKVLQNWRQNVVLRPAEYINVVSSHVLVQTHLN